MQIGMIVSRVRREEKLLMEAFQARDIQIDVFNDGEFILNPLDPDPRWLAYDLILERSISSSRTLTTLQILEAWGVPTLNNFHTASTCSDKLSTTLALARHSVPQAQVSIAFTEDSILQAIENQGYPAVLKPLTGSWGRLVTKVNDRESAEAILEHRFTLGNYPYHTGYVQEFVRKPNGRDIRSFVVGGQALCAIYRTSEHWITNTARGGVASNCEISGEIADISISLKRTPATWSTKSTTRWNSATASSPRGSTSPQRSWSSRSRRQRKVPPFGRRRYEYPGCDRRWIGLPGR
ncbi:MAG: RimK family alpha-L-glutamate ligase [Anaerolineales bacterium]